MIRILFLCHGNICRSPMAEMIFNELAKNDRDKITADSMAVSAEEIGHPVYPEARDVLRAHGIPVSPHRAKQITREDYEAYDAVILMEEYNRGRLNRIIGADDQQKVHLLMDFTDHPGDIEDPWYSGNFDRVFEQITEGCRGVYTYWKGRDFV